MRWYYKLIERGERYFIYAYSRECKKYDGRIKYDINSKNVDMITPSHEDSKSVWAQQKALEHFNKVIINSFPEDCSVCCG